jgi:uncharacterized protein YqgC (DUF456 family)
MVPIFPMILGEFISVMSGSLIIEQMFTIPGVGALYINSVQGSIPDYNFFMLLTCFYTLIGLVAGIILTPIGMIAGSFLGAFIAEVQWGKKTSSEALLAALGSFLGFILGTGIKTIASVLILWQIIVYAF